LSDKCNNCIKANNTYAEYVYWMTTGGCGNLVKRGGNGEANVEYLLTSVFTKVNEYLKVGIGHFVENHFVENY
jgi:hypothetical protein